MHDIPALTLRYFDCRGRAQPFRYYLRVRNIPFIDARVSLADNRAAWLALRDNRALTGPFRKLPVLHWGEQLLAESQVIHDFLHHKLGDAARLGEQENLQHAMIASSCRSELMVPIGQLIWQEAACPGSSVSTTAPQVLARMQDHLQALETALVEWQWFARLAKRPLMLADCVLWEELDAMHTTFGPHVDWTQAPQLQHFHADGAGQALFRRMQQEHPGHITGNPQEADVIRRIQAAVAAAR